MIWYNSKFFHEDEQIRFDKRFTIISKVVSGVINTIFYDFLILYINGLLISITNQINAGQEKYMNSFVFKNRENLSGCLIKNYQYKVGCIRF